MARAITSPELAYLRGPRQRTRLFVDADVPPVVFACQVNQSFSSLDMVLELTYNNVTAGAYADVLAGMTVLVGSMAGAGDLGECRIRKAADATKVYIGLTSEIPWADDIYLTVLDEFRLWAKPLAVNESGAVLVDGETLYSDQNDDFAPVIIAGPARRVARLEGEYVDVAFDLSDSWVPGSSISSRSVSAPGSASVTGGTTATPTVRYDEEGRYRIAFTAVAANGKSSIAYRTVRIYSDADPLLTVFGPPEASGDQEDGGWQMRLNVYLPQSTLTIIRKHAMITLVAEDWYDETKVSLGPVVGSENVVAIGWLAASETRSNPRTGGTAKLEVMGPPFWMANIGASMLGLNNAATTPTEWNEMLDLTVDQALHQLVCWRSTIAAVMDAYPSGDTRIADIFPNAETTLWGQLMTIGGRILARPLCDRYGRLFLRIDPQFRSEADRAGFPTVITLQKADWRDELVVRQNLEQVTQLIQVASLVGGGEIQAIYSLAAGHIFKHFGAQAASTEADLIVASQAQANEIAGLRLARANREFEFEISVGQNNRFVDIAPEQYVALELAAGDTPRGIEFDGRIVVRHVELKYDARSGFLWFEWSGEQETFGENAVDGDIPEGNELPSTPSFPPLPPLPPLPDPPITPIPVGEDGPQYVVLAIPGKGVWYTEDFNTTFPHWHGWNNGLDAGAITNIWNLEISLVSSKAILHTHVFGGEGRLWASDGPGEEWTLIYGTTGGAGQPVCVSAGMHRGVADEVAALTADLHPITGGWGVNTFWAKGDTGGIARTGSAIPSTGSNIGGECFYGNNKWVASRAWLPGAVEEATRGGVHVAQHQVGSVEYVPCVRPGIDSPVVWAHGSLVGSQISLDDGGTWAEVVKSPYEVGNASLYRRGIGFSPTGQYCIVSEVFSASKSSDYGASFGAISGALGAGSVCNLGDMNNWLIQTALRVYFTHDFGTTWVDRGGDIATLLGIGWYARVVREF